MKNLNINVTCQNINLILITKPIEVGLSPLKCTNQAMVPGLTPPLRLSLRRRV
jgi:hypothetical protein